MLRNYSLSGPPGAGYYRITVKREHDGAASGYLHTRLAVGDQLDVAAPRGTFILDRTRRARAADQRRHRRHAGARHAPRAGGGAFRAGDLVAARRAQQPRPLVRRRGPRAARLAPERAQPTSTTAVPARTTVEGRDFDSAGRLTASLLAELEPPRDAEAYLCGPTPFMEEISAGLAAIGHRRRRASTPSRSGPRPGLTPGIAATPARTPHPPAGRTRRRPDDRVRPQQPRRSRGAATTPACSSSPKHATCPSAGRAAPASATTARPTLIAGDVDYSPDPVEPPADGSALICCSQPRDDVVLDL